MLTLLGSLHSNFSFAVALASIPELPAETCKEIKASEFGQVVSGKYWLSGIKPGVTVLAHCDMETEGASSYVTSPLHGANKFHHYRVNSYNPVLNVNELCVIF